MVLPYRVSYSDRTQVVGLGGKGLYPQSPLVNPRGFSCQGIGQKRTASSESFFPLGPSDQQALNPLGSSQMSPVFPKP